MYVVFIASSVPTSVPFLNRHSPKSHPTTYQSYKRRNATMDSSQGDDNTALTLSSVPPGRVNAYASAARGDSPTQGNNEGNAEDLWAKMRRGDILKTTKIDVTRDRESEVVASS